MNRCQKKSNIKGNTATIKNSILFFANYVPGIVLIALQTLSH